MIPNLLRHYIGPLVLWGLVFCLILMVFPVDPTILSVARDAHLSRTFTSAAAPKFSADLAWTFVSKQDPKPRMIWFIKDEKYFFPTRPMRHMDSLGHYGYQDVGWYVDPYTGDFQYVGTPSLAWLPVDFGTTVGSP